MGHVRQPSDHLDRYLKLRRRIRNLLTGVTPMRFYMGAYGGNTQWARLTPAVGWKYSDAETFIRWRLRSDVVYLNTKGPGGIEPVSGSGWPTLPALYIPGKPNVAWPSTKVTGHCGTTEEGVSDMTVKPDGAVYFTQPSIGRVIKPGSCSWPRG